MQSELLGVVSRTTRALLDGVVLQAPIGGQAGPSLWPVPSAVSIPNGPGTPSQIPNGDGRQKGGHGSGSGNTQPNHPLPELLYTLLDQFRRIAEGHRYVLKRMGQTCEKYNFKNIRLYEISDLWSMVQAVVSSLHMCNLNSEKQSSFLYIVTNFSLQMQLVLTDYLDIQNTAADAQKATSSFSEQSSDISSYFSRRKIQRFVYIFCVHILQ